MWLAGWLATVWLAGCGNLGSPTGAVNSPGTALTPHHPIRRQFGLSSRLRYPPRRTTVLQLYYYPDNASFAPHVCLREAGARYELVKVDRTLEAHKSPDYLKLNPSGRIPTLVDGDLVLFETAAICLYIADSHAESGLAPPSGTRERAVLHKWLFYMATTIQPELLVYHYASRYAADSAGEEAVKAGAEARLAEMFEVMDEAVVRRPFLMGESFTLLDPYLAMLCRWARELRQAPGKLGHLGPYLENIVARASVARTIEREGIEPPFL
ncbi:MAG TPA: glutathione S-transferase family protein [Alphaproteobacteria bacterium]|nr:glutathione S-transferase family protein [Alphaproteobacteria bacterium]HJM48752.1 glutathione S-transferase family protein [Alphaproteobacteria bacterium]